MIAQIVAGVSFFAHTVQTPDSGWERYEGDQFYFEVPSYMNQVEDLHDECEYQFSSVRQQGKEVLEVYCLILPETKEELSELGLENVYNALSYWEAAELNLTSILDKKKILTKNLTVETRNGMQLVRGNIFGKFGKIKVIYHLGVYEGRLGFYQIVTWTIADQFEMFKSDMEGIVTSFREK
ncbi:MAG: hypothetical protein JNJ99_00100 [Crocinitomicaceae bacterium]|nr:hypothetical protein [Crocinitomicaceae bacterium]